VNTLRFAFWILLATAWSGPLLWSQSDTTLAGRKYREAIDAVTEDHYEKAFEAFGQAAHIFENQNGYARATEALLQQCYLLDPEKDHETLSVILDHCKSNLKLVQDIVLTPRLAIEILLVNLRSAHTDTLARNQGFEAIELLQKYPVLEDSHGAAIYYEIGNHYFNRELFDSCTTFLEMALPLAKPKGHEVLAGDICLLWGKALRRIGDSQKALNLIKEGIVFYEKDLGQVHTKIASAYNDLSLIQELMGDQIGSGNSLSKALKIRENLFGRNSNEYGTVLNNTSLHFLEQGQLERAFELAKQTVSIFENNPKPDKRFHVASYNSLAQAYEKKGDLLAAQKNYQRAVDLHEKYFPGNPRVRFYFLDLGRNAIERKEYREAVYFFHQAMSASIPGIDKNDIDQNPDREDPSNYLSLRSLCLLKGSAWHKVYAQTKDTVALSKAIYLYELADFFATKNRVEVQYQKSREAFSKQNLSLYEGAILACVNMWEETGQVQYLKKSFLLNEKSKSLTLLQNLLDASAMHTSGLPTAILDQEKVFQDSLLQLRGQLIESRNVGDSLDMVRIGSHIFDLDIKYEDFKKALERDFPKYYQSKYNYQFKSPDEIQAALSPEQSLVEYFVGEQNIFIYTINNDHFQCYRVARPDSLQTWVLGLLASLQSFDISLPGSGKENVRAVKDYIHMAGNLYQLLWQSCSDQLRREVVIVPDAILNYIPFGALLSDAPKNEQNFKTYPYLEFAHVLSYNYSATLGDQMINSLDAKNSRSLSVAPSFDITNAEGLTPLLFNVEEAKNVQRVMKGKVLANHDATEQRFRDACAEFGIFHFATHAIVDENNADFSFLAFQPDSAKNNLYLQELYNIHLPAYMVTLSACQTNMGPLLQGEGIASLAKGFSYAGTKSIITSLWDVDDLAALDLMNNFYQGIAQEQRKNLALQQAKHSYINGVETQRAHPVYWATFIPIGDMSPIASHRINFTYLIIFIGLLLSLFIYHKLKRT
jgi:CHAT domain-containing protein/tetratricopeptide (TPR) repeat protein